MNFCVNVGEERFTGKEFDQEGDQNGANGIDAYYFGARFYDPVTGVWLSTDRAGQYWNNYGYPGNPISYIDEDGNIAFSLAAGIGIGMIVGAFVGGQMAYAEGAEGWDAVKYFYGGAAVGAAAGAASGGISAAGFAGSATLATVAASSINSLGFYALSGGQTDFSTNFGAFSMNWSEGAFESFNSGRSWQENLGYAFGAYSNLGDAILIGQQIGIAFQKAKLGNEYERIMTQRALDRIKENKESFMVDSDQIGGNDHGMHWSGIRGNPPGDPFAPGQPEGINVIDRIARHHDKANYDLYGSFQNRAITTLFDRRTSAHDMLFSQRVWASFSEIPKGLRGYAFKGTGFFTFTSAVKFAADPSYMMWLNK